MFRFKKQRRIVVFINPVSGKRASRRIFKTTLQPMLDFVEVDYSYHLTTSATFLNEFFKSVSYQTMSYTDFVVIGGDGMISQLLEAIMSHPDKEELIKIPMAIMPGGTQNALACDLGGKKPLTCALNILRGNYLPSDVFECTLSNKNEENKVSEETKYATAFSYGILSDVVVKSEKYRKMLGKHRYAFQGVKMLVTQKKAYSYKASVTYKTSGSSEDLVSGNTVSSTPDSPNEDSDNFKGAEAIEDQNIESEWESMPSDDH